MFSASVQPALVSLFSSTSSDPLALFAVQTDPALPADSVVCLLEDASSSPSPPPPAKLIAPPVLTLDSGQRAEEGYALSQTVLHIQSPTLRTTYIRCPPTPGGVLGMKHPWIHLQVRNMEKEWSFEAGIVDRAGRQGVVRFSTFQKTPRLKPGDLPVLHLPLSFPSSSSSRLTTWSTITVNLASLLPRFADAFLFDEAEGDREDSESDERGVQASMRVRARLTGVVPSGSYSHVAYVKVYATCRLRRIWFSQSGSTQNLPWEFELYSATY